MTPKQQKTAEQALERVKQILAAPLKSGGAAKLAIGLKLTKSAISQWTVVPRDHVLAVEALVGGRVPRHELRPDFYPPPDLRKAG